MGGLKPRRFTIILAVASLTVGLALSTMLLLPHRVTELTPRGTTRLMAADIASSGDYTIEQTRALKAAVFVGRVIERDGEVDIGDAGFPFVVPIYAVDVETTLKGDTQGRVWLAVVEIDVPEAYGGGAVAVGDQYCSPPRVPTKGCTGSTRGSAVCASRVTTRRRRLSPTTSR